MAQNENTPVNQEKSGIIGFLSGVKSELKKLFGLLAENWFLIQE
ncbi:hypothetical protein MHY_20660 [Megamonas hypermegale ART12/1]|nr:hypothetical protein MHY_20660 [Megamonas hypermegale ART12/1]